ncbi:MAG: acetylxylan esterase [bacterium]
MIKSSIPLIILLLSISANSFANTYTKTFPEGWNLIGLPCSQPSFDIVIDDLKNLIIFSYSDTNRTIPSITNISEMEPGKGYWLWLPSSRAISLTGAQNPSASFNVQFNAGWNLFSVPYSLPVCWNEDNVSADDGAVSFSGAFSAGPYSYSPSDSRYKRVSLIKPWSAYWVWADAPVETNIKLTGTSCAEDGDCIGESSYCKNPCKSNAQCVQCQAGQVWNGTACYLPVECTTDVDCASEKPYCLYPGQVNAKCIACDFGQVWDGAKCVTPVCSTHSDCSVADTYCKDPATANAVCVSCLSGQIWDTVSQSCYSPVCFSDSDCGQDQHCKNAAQVDAECITCNIGMVWDSTAQECVTPACWNDDECGADSYYCENPGQPDAQCKSCPEGQLWSGTECITPACYSHTDCGAARTYCKNPGLVTAVCITCESGQIWDSANQVCFTPACYSDVDCAEGKHCRSPGRMNAECVICVGGTIWDPNKSYCVTPSCFTDADCPGGGCINDGQLTAECITCGGGTTWNPDTETCVTPACSADSDCGGGDNHCVNAGQYNAECVTCGMGQVWNGSQCVTPACAGYADCQAGGNYMTYCKSPATADAACVTCSSQYTWDVDANACVPLYDMNFIRNIGATQCVFSNYGSTVVTPPDDLPVTVNTWDLELISYESVDGQIHPIKIRGFAAVPSGGGAYPGVVQAHGLGGYAQESDAPKLAAMLKMFTVAITAPGSGDPNNPRTQSEGLGPNYQDGYRLFDTLADTRGSWFWSYSVAIMRALNCMQMIPQYVDSNRLGVTGYSAGGVETLLVAGRDDRIKTGVPLSGTHAWEEAVKSPNAWQNALLSQAHVSSSHPAWQKLISEMITPAVSVSGTQGKINMFDGSIDEFFPLTALVATYNQITTDKRLSIAGNYDHGCYVLGIPIVPESKNTIEERASLRVNGGQRAWFRYIFNTDSTYSYFPSPPSILNLTPVDQITYIQVIVDSGGPNLAVDEVKFWVSNDNSLGFIADTLIYKGSGVYEGKESVFGQPGFVFIPTGPNSVYFIDVQYKTLNPLLPQKFSVSSVPVMPAGHIPTIRNINTCQP